MAIALYLAYSTSTDLTIQCSGLDTLSPNAKELDWECWDGSTLVGSTVTYVAASSSVGYGSFSGLDPSTTYHIHCDVFDQSPTTFLDDADGSFTTDAPPPPTPTTTSYVWDGSAWQPATPYIWDGSAWQPATAYIWDGTNWQPQ